MPCIFSNTVKNNRGIVVISAIGSNGKLNIYSNTDVLLAQWLWNTNMFETPVNGIYSILPPVSTIVMGLTNGVASYATVTDSSDNTIISGLSIGTDVIISNTNIVQNEPLTLNNFTITEG